MAHEITSTDGAVFHRTPAWHKLGTVVWDAPTPSEALKIAGLDWDLEQVPVFAGSNEIGILPIPKHKANVRSDNKDVLGIVSDQYKPVQNSQLAEFAEQLAEQNDTVRLESAGSVRGGKAVWLLLKGESFSARSGEEIAPYIAISSSHDGSSSVKVTPTSVRVVCANTLQMVVENGSAVFQFNHNGDLQKHIDDVKQALGLYGKAQAETRQVIDTLAARDVNSEMVKQFFLECYTADYGPIPVDPKDEKEVRKRTKAMEKANLFGNLFDVERDRVGANRWAMFNAYSELVQHHGHLKKQDSRAYSNLLGLNADRTNNAFELAISM